LASTLHLSDQDLKDLGVSLGHRRKIFAAINKGIASLQPLAEIERPEDAKIPEAPERRYVTILFSDLVGSTALSTRLDPEDLRSELAAQLLGLAEKRGATTPLMIGHRVMGNSLPHAGNIAECRVHFDQAIAFYDPDKHRSLVTRFGQDMKVIVLSWRASALWLLGYPEAALADANEAIRYAREIGHAATLMYALGIAPLVVVARGDYATADLLSDEVIGLADQKGALFWKVFGMRLRGQCLACTGRAAQAVKVLTAAANAYRSTGSTALVPLDQLYFAKAYAELGQFADASSCIDEAMATLEKNKDRLWEAEVLRLSGEIAPVEKVPSATKAPISSALSLSPGNSKPNPGNSAPP
jgi:tetratricopeptide (TPR) repeat protein